jgi:hypothetical protein
MSYNAARRKQNRRRKDEDLGAPPQTPAGEPVPLHPFNFPFFIFSRREKIKK